MGDVTCGNCEREFDFPKDIDSINCACGAKVFRPKKEPKPPEEGDFKELSRDEQLKALEKMTPKDRKIFEKDLKPEKKEEKPSKEEKKDPKKKK